MNLRDEGNRERSLLLHILLRSLLSVHLPLVLLGCAVANQQPRPASPIASPKPSVSTEIIERSSDRIDRPTSEPYSGSLSIFEDPKREDRLQVNRVMDVLGITTGSSVADVGAASGWFTVRAAKRVGADGLVYAVEINSEYLKHIDKRSKEENLSNIRTILGKEDDPLLPVKSVDAVLLLKTYHEIGEPVLWLRRLRPAMRVGARLGIIDRTGKGDNHGIDRKTVVKEAQRAGFVLVEQHDFVRPDEVDYFLVFRVR
ncbi:MAG: class I SAM-dependent methyltransferase [Pyrinomonadaceae bacterium]|nr:class I SAM-dependent methyltransferase [Pyrinomonadaceae bacterium]